MAPPRPHSGWQEENQRIADARRPFIRRVRAALQVDGLQLVTAAPSERRMAAGIEAQSYYTYPLLFYPYFPEISLAQLNTLSLCGSYLFDHVLCVDRLLDRSPHGDPGTLLLGLRCQREAMALLLPLFPPGHSFWESFERFESHFSQALLQERARHHCLVTPYTTEGLEFIYSGKPAVAKAALAALGLLTRHEDIIPRLCASHDAFYVAFQLIDDLLDWRSDYQNRQYSYPLTHAFSTAGWASRVEGQERPGLDRVAELLAEVDVVGHVRKLAAEYLARARAPLEDLPDSAWAAAILKIDADVARLDLGSLSAGTMPAAAGASVTVAGFDTPDGGLALPLARRWSAWLDPRRPAAPTDGAILAHQQALLRGGGGATSVGQALGQVGLAIEASRRHLPAHGLAQHLGMSVGEIEWCRHNEAWLHTLLADSLDDPAWLWAPAEAGSSAAGFMPLTVGRYLGHRLVEEYPLPLDFERCDGPQVEDVLRHYRRQLAA